MVHKGTKTLSGNKLILRQLCESDIQPCYNNWTTDTETTKYLTWKPHGSLEETAKLIKEIWIPDYAKNDFYQWAIIPNDVGECIGTISVVDADERVGMLEVGYCIGSSWWNKGYMTESLSLVIDYLINEVGATRVQAKHDTNNPASGRVMAKCGMKYEGTLRKSDINNQGIVDCAFYAILASEYAG